MSFLSKIAFTMCCVFAAAPAMAGSSIGSGSVSVPEPVSLSLLALGVGGVAIVRGLRIRRK